MVIDLALNSHIERIQGRYKLCHQVTFSILCFGKMARHNAQDMSISFEFANKLAQNKGKEPSYDLSRNIPPHLYGVFGLFTSGTTNLIHSAIIIEEEPPFMVAELGNLFGKINFLSLHELIFRGLRQKNDLILFSSDTIDQILDTLSFFTHL